jgi:hypothetical protein
MHGSNITCSGGPLFTVSYDLQLCVHALTVVDGLTGLAGRPIFDTEADQQPKSKVLSGPTSAGLQVSRGIPLGPK